MWSVPWLPFCIFLIQIIVPQTILDDFNYEIHYDSFAYLYIIRTQIKRATHFHYPLTVRQSFVRDIYGMFFFSFSANFNWKIH